MNTDGGGDRNHMFDLAQASVLCLVWTFNLQKITCVKPTAGVVHGINPRDPCIH